MPTSSSFACVVALLSFSGARGWASPRPRRAASLVPRESSPAQAPSAPVFSAPADARGWTAALGGESLALNIDELFVVDGVPAFRDVACIVDLASDGSATFRNGLVADGLASWRVSDADVREGEPAGAAYFELAQPVTKWYRSSFDIPSEVIFWRGLLTSDGARAFVVDGTAISEVPSKPSPIDALRGLLPEALGGDGEGGAFQREGTFTARLINEAFDDPSWMPTAIGADGAPAAADAGSKFAFEGGGSKRKRRSRKDAGGNVFATAAAAMPSAEQAGKTAGPNVVPEPFAQQEWGTLTDLGIPAMSDEAYEVFLREFRAVNGVDFESTISKADRRDVQSPLSGRRLQEGTFEIKFGKDDD